MAKIPEHKDLFGRIINVGDAVCAPIWGGNTLKKVILGIGIVTKLNQKTVSVNILPHTSESASGRKLCPPNALLIVNCNHSTMYILSHS